MLEWIAVVKGARRPVGPVLVFSAGITPEDRAVSAIYGGEPEASFDIVIARWRRGAWRDWKRGWIIHDVTHWMPLPEPPAATDTPKGGEDDTPSRTHYASGNGSAVWGR